MRTITPMKSDVASFPLLESGDLPGEEDWNVLESLHQSDDLDDDLDNDDDQLATLTVARSFDD